MAKTKAQPKPVRLYARAWKATIPVRWQRDDAGIFRLIGVCGWIGGAAEVFIEWEPPQPYEGIGQAQAMLTAAGYSNVKVRRSPL